MDLRKPYESPTKPVQNPYDIHLYFSCVLKPAKLLKEKKTRETNVHTFPLLLTLDIYWVWKAAKILMNTNKKIIQTFPLWPSDVPVFIYLFFIWIKEKRPASVAVLKEYRELQIKDVPVLQFSVYVLMDHTYTDG